MFNFLSNHIYVCAISIIRFQSIKFVIKYGIVSEENDFIN